MAASSSTGRAGAPIEPGVRARPGWPFYPAWVLAHMLGLVAAWYIALEIILQVERIVGDTIQVAGQTHITEDYLLMYILLPVIGLMTGLLEFLLLQRYIPRLRGWVLATLLGWLLPLGITRIFAALLASTFNPGTFWGMVGFALIGACIGLPQWWLLRRRLPQAFWWLLACALGWGLVGLMNGVSYAPYVILLVVAGVPSILTGAVCWHLLDWLPGHADASRPQGAA